MASSPVPILEQITAASFTIGTTAVQLAATSTPISGIVLKSLSTNTGTIYIGGSSGVTSASGYELKAGEVLNLDENDLQNIWVIASAAGQDLRTVRGVVTADT